jgi:hypothetical protein
MNDSAICEEDSLSYIDRMHEQIVEKTPSMDKNDTNCENMDKGDQPINTNMEIRESDTAQSRKEDPNNRLFEMMNKVLIDITEMKKEITTELIEIKESMAFRDKQCQEAVANSQTALEETIKLKGKILSLESELEREKNKRVRLETELRSKNLIMMGVKEYPIGKNEEDIQATTKQTIFDIFGEIDIAIDVCYRLGKASSKNTDHHPRPIMVKFQNQMSRDLIWRNKHKLKGTQIHIKEDIPEEIERNVRKLVPILKAARKMDLKSNLTRDTLTIAGEKYHVNNLDRLPKQLQPSELATKESESHIFFWGQDSKLSNFNTDFPFNIGSTKFTSIEQYYTCRKADHFNDNMAKQKILNTENPAECKKIRIAGFNETQWQRVAPAIMKEGLYAKFMQNESLKLYLLKTKEKTLCEASPRDKYWGIGMGLHDKDLLDKRKWGKNVLGKILMELREELVT